MAFAELAAISSARSAASISPVLDRALGGARLSEADAIALIDCPAREFGDLLDAAGELRDRGKGRDITYSRKVFLPDHQSLPRPMHLLHFSQRSRRPRRMDDDARRNRRSGRAAETSSDARKR